MYDSLAFTFVFQSLFLLVDDVFPRFVYAVIALETAALDTSHKVAILGKDAPAKRTQTLCPF